MSRRKKGRIQSLPNAREEMTEHLATVKALAQHWRQVVLGQKPPHDPALTDAQILQQFRIHATRLADELGLARKYDLANRVEHDAYAIAQKVAGRPRVDRGGAA